MTWLDNSRILAMFAVVFLHAAGPIVVEGDIGTEYWWVGNLYDSLMRWCVPVFIMISGALLLDTSKKEDLNTFYSKRISKIFAPIIFWTAFYLAWVSLKGVIKGNPLSVSDLATSMLSGTPHYHMWFLYMIAILYIFVPFLRKVVASSTRKELIVLSGISLILSAINDIADIFWPKKVTLFVTLFLSYIPYFFIGHLIRTADKNYSKITLWAIFSISFIFTAASFYIASKEIGIGAGMYFYSFLSVTVIPMSISAMLILRSCSRPLITSNITKKISALTLGVYLIHPVFLETISRSGYGASDFHPAISIPLIACIVFCLSLISAWAISRTPLLSKVI